MSRLLSSGAGATRECLRKQLGRIAERNSCAGPWVPSLDLQFNFRPAQLGLDGRLTISVLALNVLAGLDRLLHSTGKLRRVGAASIRRSHPAVRAGIRSGTAVLPL
jgi:hypothetical protein